MAPKPRSPRPTRADDERAFAVSGLVETLVGKAAPRLLRPLPRWEDIVSAVARSGTGGRRKRIDVGFEIEATRELRERYCAPQAIPHRGSLLLIWEMNDDGDGIIAARLSSQDVQKGETAMGQIHNGLALAAGHGLKPACAVVAMPTSGGPTTTAASTSRSSATASRRAAYAGSPTASPTASPATYTPHTPSTSTCLTSRLRSASFGYPTRPASPSVVDLQILYGALTIGRRRSV
jgi:hypothetical protein